jgi:ribosomal protein L31
MKFKQLLCSLFGHKYKIIKEKREGYLYYTYNICSRCNNAFSGKIALNTRDKRLDKLIRKWVDDAIEK